MSAQEHIHLHPALCPPSPLVRGEGGRARQSARCNGDDGGEPARCEGGDGGGDRASRDPGGCAGDGIAGDPDNRHCCAEGDDGDAAFPVGARNRPDGPASPATDPATLRQQTLRGCATSPAPGCASMGRDDGSEGKLAGGGGDEVCVGAGNPGDE